MYKNSILSEEKFWFVVDYVLENVEEMSVSDLISDLKITKDQFNCFYTFFKDIGLDLTIEKNILSIKGKKDITFSMSLKNWLKLQAHFPAIDSLRNEPFHEDIGNYFSELEKEYEENDLFSSIDNLEAVMPKNIRLAEESMIAFLEENIVHENIILLEMNGIKHEVFPHRVISIGGSLELIYENIQNHTLDMVNCNLIQSFEISMSKSTSVFKKQELDNFIKNVRMLESNEERIILKVIDDSYFNTSISHEYFRNEVIVKNHLDQNIWSASIEVNDNICDWLFNLGESIEILGADNIKKAYLKFCQRKLKKLA